MRRILDLALLALLLGTPIFLLVVLPDRSSSARPATKNLELPRPRGLTPTPPESRILDPDLPVSSGSAGEEPSRVKVIPQVGSFDLRGLYFRGGGAPLAGEVPIAVEGGLSPVADEQGQFRLQIPAGPLGLGGLDASCPIIDLDKNGGSGLLSVHRYDPSEGGAPLLEPISALLLQPKGGTPRLLVCGRSTLPDGAQLAVRLLAAGHGLESILLRVNDRKFAGEIPISPRDYHAGVYLLQFAWGRTLATREILDTLDGNAVASFDGEYQRDVGVFFGTPEEARLQEREVRDFYRGALDDLEGMRDLLLVSGAEARGRRSKLLKDSELMARLRAHPLANSTDGLFRDGKLELSRWRRLIDEQIPERVSAYTMLEEIPFGTKHPQAAHNLVMLSQHVRKYSKLESTIVYGALGLHRHQNDFVPNYDFGPETERTLTLQRIQNFADAVRQFIGL